MAPHLLSCCFKQKPHKVISDDDDAPSSPFPHPVFSGSENIIAVLKDATGFSVLALEETEHDDQTIYKITQTKTSRVPDAVKPLVIAECPVHLRPSASHHIHIVVSTKSGICRASAFNSQAVTPLLRLLQSYGSPAAGFNTLITDSATSIKHFATHALTSPGQTHTVLLLSGDGGTIDLLNAIGAASPSAQTTTIAMLPLGTGNALFHSLHRPLYTNEAQRPLVLGLRTLIHGAARALPVFRADFSPGAEVVGFAESQNRMAERPVEHLYGAIVASHGLHASIVYESDTPEYRKHGDKRFGMVAGELVKLNHAYTARVAVSRPGGNGSLEQLKNSEYGYILATMVSSLEKSFTISPASKPCDGKLRLVSFAPVGEARTMDIMMAAYNNGAHVDLPDVDYQEINNLKVTVSGSDERWRKFCIDGTIVSVPEGGWMTVKPVEHSPLKVLAMAT
ncbi:hypothetical protein TD95_001468 [Thielaviopsis punctulata]|uniref:DAGKc domain-containing protein n=1 Tax=Thielaviopsis punctulata TaxID=72032 RepID=A0A0F4ZHB8_9PEZI|nr:hypothetical protein TD95_001468 [Thielaviopsis punctulata]